MFEPPLKTENNCAVVGWCCLLSGKKKTVPILSKLPPCIASGYATVPPRHPRVGHCPPPHPVAQQHAEPILCQRFECWPNHCWVLYLSSIHLRRWFSPISVFFLRYERTLASLEVGFPLHQPYPYSWCGFLYLHFRYLFKVWWWFLVIWEKKTSFCLVEAMTFSREMTGFHVKGWKTPQLGIQKIGQTAVDGSETQPENQPEVGSLSPVFTRGLLHPRWELSHRISGCNQQFHKCSLGHSPHLPWWNNSWSPYCGMDFESWVPHISSSHSKSKSSLWNQNCEYVSEKN